MAKKKGACKRRMKKVGKVLLGIVTQELLSTVARGVQTIDELHARGELIDVITADDKRKLLVNKTKMDLEQAGKRAKTRAINLAIEAVLNGVREANNKITDFVDADEDEVIGVLEPKD